MTPEVLLRILVLGHSKCEAICNCASHWTSGTSTSTAQERDFAPKILSRSDENKDGGLISPCSEVISLLYTNQNDTCICNIVTRYPKRKWQCFEYCLDSLYCKSGGDFSPQL